MCSEHELRKITWTLQFTAGQFRGCKFSQYINYQQTISDSLNAVVNTKFKYPQIYAWVKKQAYSIKWSISQTLQKVKNAAASTDATTPLRSFCLNQEVSHGSTTTISDIIHAHVYRDKKYFVGAEPF